MTVKFPQSAVRRGAGLLLCCSACGSTGPSEPGTPSEACANRPVTQLAVGDHVVLDPAATGGCLRLPAAGAGGAQYLLVLASTNGSRSSDGISGSYLLRASQPVAAVAPPAELPSRAAALAPGNLGARFDATLRQLEGELASDPRNRPLTSAASGPAVAPPLGDVKSFKTCSNLACSTFTTVTATARYIGTHVAVYVDNDVPQNDPLTDGDLANLGHAFDNYHYPIDTTAFGRESDIDGNGVVVILATDAVNNLTPDCSNGRVIGYFFGGDLLTGPNSNRAEIFYTLVPAPATAKCTAVSRAAAIGNLKPTLIHEFQHMISFNQHVLVRGGSSEEVWLNEAMSHFAEELGGRQVPDAECTADNFTSCRSQYSGGNILDAYDYLKNPESQFMVFPTSSTGTLEERGAVWLFLRWVLDHFSGADSILATATTRALDATNQTGVVNVIAVTGGNFSEMVPRWLMASYLDDGSDLPFESTGWLRYKSWGLRSIWTDPRNSQIFPAGFPLVPTNLSTTSIAGTLRAGSGRHFLLQQLGNAAAWDMQVLKNSAGAQLDASLQARFGVVRIR